MPAAGPPTSSVSDKGMSERQEFVGVVGPWVAVNASGESTYLLGAL